MNERSDRPVFWSVSILILGLFLNICAMATTDSLGMFMLQSERFLMLVFEPIALKICAIYFDFARHLSRVRSSIRHAEWPSSSANSFVFGTVSRSLTISKSLSKVWPF